MWDLKKYVLAIGATACVATCPFVEATSVEASVVVPKKISRHERNRLRSRIVAQARQRATGNIFAVVLEILAALGVAAAVGGGGWYAKKHVPKMWDRRQLDKALKKIVDDPQERGDKQLRPDIAEVEVTAEEIDEILAQDEQNRLEAIRRQSDRGWCLHGGASVAAGIYLASYSRGEDGKREYAGRRIKEGKLSNLNNVKTI